MDEIGIIYKFLGRTSIIRPKIIYSCLREICQKKKTVVKKKKKLFYKGY